MSIQVSLLKKIRQYIKYRDENGLEFEVKTWVEATPFEMQRIESDYIEVLLRSHEDYKKYS